MDRTIRSVDYGPRLTLVSSDTVESRIEVVLIFVALDFARELAELLDLILRLLRMIPIRCILRCAQGSHLHFVQW